MTISKLTCSLLCIFLALSCKPNDPNSTGGIGNNGVVKLKPKNFLMEIDSLSEYTELMGEPLSAKFSNVTSVKVIYDLDDDKVYFIQSGMYKYHYEFATAVLGYRNDLYVFNSNNYNEDPGKRDYLLGNLNYIPQTSDFFIELSPSDWMDIISIEKLYRGIEEKLHITDTVFFYANTPRLMQAFEEGLLIMPVITTERIFGTIEYQPISFGKTNGILKKYNVEDLDSLTPNPNEIIVLDKTPLVLPRVKGVIVSELQTPLSHLVLLGRNRRIPIAAQKNIWDNDKLKYFLDQPIEFEIFKDSFGLKLITDPIEVNSNTKTIVLPMDTSVHQIIDLSIIPDLGIEKIGSKAFHYSLLYQIALKKKSFKVPEYGMAIPYFFYWQHFINSGSSKLVSKLIASKTVEKEKEILKEMRKLIKEHPINKSLLDSVEARIRKQNKFTAFRFRSSTNAEDLPEFNGAGLYDSETGILNDKEKSFEKAIKKVWSSTWSERAYYERKYFGIDQQSISMGVLVHRSFPDEEANGVVVTQNIYRSTGGITVNVQKGEASVVMPKNGEVTEIFTAYQYHQAPWVGKLIIDYVSFSPLNNFKPIMSETEIMNLFNAIIQIKQEILTNKAMYGGVNRKFAPGKNTEFDLEFKLMGKKRELYIKQVRVYK
jgi:pyruvate,water dikinase